MSDRLLPRADPRLFQVAKVVGHSSVVLRDPDTGETDLGFAQPVALDRLVLFDMCDLEEPTADDDVMLELRRAGEWRRAQVTAQLAAGKVRLKFRDYEEVVDLGGEEYRWVMPGADGRTDA